eukprot:2964571-Prymnesium_polylepis.1
MPNATRVCRLGQKLLCRVKGPRSPLREVIHAQFRYSDANASPPSPAPARQRFRTSLAAACPARLALNTPQSPRRTDKSPARTLARHNSIPPAHTR